METLSERLTFALRELKVTQAELARQLKVKPQAINFLCKSKTLKSKMTYDIAEILGISGEWLACGTGSLKEYENPDVKFMNSHNKVPLLERSYLKEWVRHAETFAITHQKNEAGSFLLTSANVGPRGFAIKQQDKSMYPRFDEDTILIINPDEQPKRHGFALVYIHSINDIVLRQLMCVDDELILTPLNHNMFKNLKVTKNDLIIGALVEARWQI